MTDAQHDHDPKDAPVAEGDTGPSDPESGRPLTADEGEPDVAPYAGDDDILSGHGPGAVE